MYKFETETAGCFVLSPKVERFYNLIIITRKQGLTYTNTTHSNEPFGVLCSIPDILKVILLSHNFANATRAALQFEKVILSL